MGIGHELRGDDAAGLAVVQALIGRNDLLVIEAGSAPENHTAKLRRFRPDLLLLIDAAQMNLQPGEIQVLDFDSLDGLSASTHTTPLTLIAHYVMAELDCEVLVIGIQPESTGFATPLTPKVQQAVREVCHELQVIFRITE